jgi:ATP adenylyltransferase
MTYVKRKIRKDGCFLCQKLKEDKKDEENYVLCRTNLAFVIMNVFPYSNGHLMISPHRHTGDFLDLTEEERNELMRLTQMSIGFLSEAMGAHGYNVGINLGKAAGAGLEEHLHVHVVPRWTGDTNFMPVLADVKLIPDHLDSTYHILKVLFQKVGS